jgi:hypothetical protein
MGRRGICGRASVSCQVLSPRDAVGVLFGELMGRGVAHSSGFIVGWGSGNELTDRAVYVCVRVWVCVCVWLWCV